MNQTLHIFRKDSRHLRLEIGIVVALAYLSTTGWGQFVYIVGAVILISRVVHAEAILGDRQFWLTRPYRWRDLLFAKLLFLFVWINVPVGLAQLAAILNGGYPVVYNLPGLVWMQVLVFGCALVTAAVAAVTSGILPFSSGALSLVVVLATTIRFAPRPVPAVDWTKTSVAEVLLVAAAVQVLIWQYRDRRTGTSRLWGIASVVLSAAVVMGTPTTVSLWAQSLFSKRSDAASSVKVALDLRQKRFFSGALAPFNRFQQAMVAVPLTVSGLPQGTEAVTDAVSLKFDWADGRTWHSDLKDASARSIGNGTIVMDTMGLMDAGLFRTQLNVPITVHGRLYLTVTGNRQSRTIEHSESPMNVQDGLRCMTNEELQTLDCKAFFRWPERFVKAREGQGEEAFTNLISYSPFPSELTASLGEGHFVGLPKSMPQATIETMEPLVHFHRDFELTGVCLDDFRLKPPRHP